MTRGMKKVARLEARSKELGKGTPADRWPRSFHRFHRTPVWEEVRGFHSYFTTKWIYR